MILFLSEEISQKINKKMGFFGEIFSTAMLSQDTKQNPGDPQPSFIKRKMAL